MWGEIALTFGTCAISALIPVISAELYLLGMAALTTAPCIWVLAAAAATGQITGKLAYYYAGRGMLRLPWRPARGRWAVRWQRRLARWRAAAETRSGWTTASVGTSAVLGIPPLGAMSVFAGCARLPVAMFAGIGVAGRYARFSLILALPGLLARLFDWRLPALS